MANVTRKINELNNQIIKKEGQRKKLLGHIDNVHDVIDATNHEIKAGVYTGMDLLEAQDYIAQHYDLLDDLYGDLQHLSKTISTLKFKVTDLELNFL